MAEAHAAANDLAPALLVSSVLFEVAGNVFKRESLRAAALWTLALGILGIGAAVVTGLVAAASIGHGNAIHEAMLGHRRAAYVAGGWWVGLGVWRAARRGSLSGRERPLYLALALIGAVLVIQTAQRGGHLVFRLGAGVPEAVLERALADIAGGHEHAPGEEHADGSGGAVEDGGTADTTDGEGTHAHPPGTPVHQH